MKIYYQNHQNNHKLFESGFVDIFSKDCVAHLLDFGLTGWRLLYYFVCAKGEEQLFHTNTRIWNLDAKKTKPK